MRLNVFSLGNLPRSVSTQERNYHLLWLPAEPIFGPMIRLHRSLSVGAKQDSRVGNIVGNDGEKEKGIPICVGIPFSIVAVPAGFEPAFSP